MKNNKQVQLVRYPGKVPHESDFTIVEKPLPQLSNGEFLVRSIYLSLDPWQRLRMRSPAEFRGQYGQPVALNTVLPGAVLGEIMESRNPEFHQGEIIEAKLGWQQFSVTNGVGDRHDDAAGLLRVSKHTCPLSMALSVLGRTGMTAYFALLETGGAKPDETILVSSAAGATGSLVGQIAKIHGCYVVGMTSTDEKAICLIDEFGFDEAINYQTTTDLKQDIASRCPNGVDVYLDMVGGDISDCVLEFMNDWGRWVVVGHIAEYDKPIDRHYGLRPYGHILAKRLRMEGFIVHDYVSRFDEAREAIGHWIETGQLIYREFITNGLENAPCAFIGMLSGGNVGKALVRIGSDPAD